MPGVDGPAAGFEIVLAILYQTPLITFPMKYAVNST